MRRKISDVKGGGGGEIRFRLLRHVGIILIIAGEPQKLDRQKYISLKLFFHKLFKNTIFRCLLPVVLLKLYSDKKSQLCFSH